MAYLVFVIGGWRLLWLLVQVSDEEDEARGNDDLLLDDVSQPWRRFVLDGTGLLL